jgi:UTP--glucose-1-phosphate uridylyltransferase
VKIRKAIIAVAGYGTRFLPATKVIPKELLSIVDKPVVQYLVEEAAQSGIEDIILVVREGTQAIADHFDTTRGLEQHLAEQHKEALLERVRAVSQLANFALVRQTARLPYGNGTPILAARRFIGEGEPFAYMFGDDLVHSEVPCVKQLAQLYEQHGVSGVIAAQSVPRAEINRYGAIALRPGKNPPELDSVVEKPDPEKAPTTLAQLGRFVLSSKIVEILASTQLKRGEELYLTPAIHALSQRDRVLVHEIEGTWYTTGDPLRFMKTNVEYMLRHPEFGAEFSQYLRELDVSAFKVK